MALAPCASKSVLTTISPASSVTDTGRGIPEQNLSQIFRPFYTTKGNGTGLGLSLARRIVEEHHGRIEVTSTVGKGSKFEVLLPFWYSGS